MKKNISSHQRLILGLTCACLAWAWAPTASASLTHRYSFTTDVTDSVGGANGTIVNNVTISGGAASFPGTSPSGPGADYIALPPGLISNYTTVSFEFWISPGVNGPWEELYAFGNTN